MDLLQIPEKLIIEIIDVLPYCSFKVTTLEQSFNLEPTFSLAKQIIEGMAAKEGIAFVVSAD